MRGRSIDWFMWSPLGDSRLQIIHHRVGIIVFRGILGECGEPFFVIEMLALQLAHPLQDYGLRVQQQFALVW